MKLRGTSRIHHGGNFRVPAAKMEGAHCSYPPPPALTRGRTVATLTEPSTFSPRFRSPAGRLPMIDPSPIAPLMA
jgi:hypothetical protein